ncbi:hypothetical protein KDAU_39790 [Dictyobacter aurantiacus]|uniref:Uncharacterized protein n=1 Tax=Dictyobacter aurantiacus TaxID=1936993 RepID=A0A401ZII1_9CHLR|nr:hypothetical protein KDAU_39790 [Dictyobacter aurantiacus]
MREKYHEGLDRGGTGSLRDKAGASPVEDAGGILAYGETPLWCEGVGCTPGVRPYTLFFLDNSTVLW